MESAIHSSKEIAKKLKIPDMVFQVANLADYEYQGPPPSLCISLHACDIATDYAIYSAIKANSRAIVVVPCCHRELLDASVEFSDLDRNLFRHGLLKERFSSLMTEALRGLLLEAHGYKVSISEYISPLDSPKNILIKAVKYKNDDKMAMSEYEKLSRQHGCDITLGRLLKSIKRKGIHQV
jgi:hypothetical protein